MEKQIRAMMIGAHPDDCDFRYGGIALKYAALGHKVKFLAMVNGCGGHHELKPAEIAARRKKETEAVAKMAGIEYDVWDIPDCELTADVETRKRLTGEIRKFNPDIIFCCRPNDYHADHRNASLLVQDASYLLIVPNFCPEVPAMKKMPVIMFFSDRFKNPPFVPDVIVPIDEVLDKKYEMYNCHVSQVYEWLPYTHGELDRVPTGEAERMEWYRGPRIPRDRVLTLEELTPYKTQNHSEYSEALDAAKFRDLLIRQYGEAGKHFLFAEAFQLSEYGTPLDAENIKTLFPF